MQMQNTKVNQVQMAKVRYANLIFKPNYELCCTAVQTQLRSSFGVSNNIIRNICCHCLICMKQECTEYFSPSDYDS